MSFTIGVFDMAKHHGVLPDLDLRVVAREPAAQTFTSASTQRRGDCARVRRRRLR
jgi:hypothetical protein